MMSEFCGKDPRATQSVFINFTKYSRAVQWLSGAEAGQFSRNCAQQSSREQAGSITGRQGAVVQNRTEKNKQVNIASKCQANRQVRNRRGRSQAGRKEINPRTSHRAQSGTEQVKVRTQQKKKEKNVIRRHLCSNSPSADDCGMLQPRPI